VEQAEDVVVGILERIEEVVGLTAGYGVGALDQLVDVVQAPDLLGENVVGAVAGFDELLAVVVVVVRGIQIAGAGDDFDDASAGAIVVAGHDSAALRVSGVAIVVSVRCPS
jgi:hypothetical protein